MIVNQEKCVGCGKCRIYCPVHAISVENRKAKIDLEICTECANCLRADICPMGALEKVELEWPRQVRSQMSDVTTVYRGVNGRGTEEMKTNDVTGRYTKGMVGIAIEMGRPQVSSTFRDLEKLSMTVAKFGAEFEDRNPISSYIIDHKTGQVNPDLLDERVISGIIEFNLPIERLKETIQAIIK
ncbi:MAG: 4Fe-4S binding protein, partial [Clostridia bacterium]|nr:4Fe-4S binding protein [Clostridia bacterium]